MWYESILEPYPLGMNYFAYHFSTYPAFLSLLQHNRHRPRHIFILSCLSGGVRDPVSGQAALVCLSVFRLAQYTPPAVAVRISRKSASRVTLPGLLFCRLLLKGAGDTYRNPTQSLWSSCFPRYSCTHCPRLPTYMHARL
jgi:hypothetical protein